MRDIGFLLDGYIYYIYIYMFYNMCNCVIIYVG